jgi:hypothetical protein
VELPERHLWWKRQGARELRSLLMDEWDPCLAKDVDDAADEYDTYLGPIAERLRNGASVSEIAEYLASVERDQMGIEPSPGRLRAVAGKLVAWYDDSLVRWGPGATMPPPGVPSYAAPMDIPVRDDEGRIVGYRSRASGTIGWSETTPGQS